MATFFMTVCGEVFSTKKAVTERCRSILWSYRPGDDLSPGDRDFVADLLRYHPESDEKIGAGVKDIFIMGNQWGKQGFAVRRVDGSEVDFSFPSCINGRKPDADFKLACRISVRGQIMDAKRAAFAERSVISCPITGEMISYKSCHVDHEEPDTFKVILDDFVRLKSIDPTQIEIVEVDLECRFVDKALEIEWQEYHRSRAKLRAVSVKANLSDLRRGR